MLSYPNLLHLRYLRNITKFGPGGPVMVLNSARMEVLRKISPLAACTVSLLLLIAFAGSMPRGQTLADPAPPWNSHAIEGAFAGVRVSEIDPSKAEVVFFYDLDNKTDNDYQLSKGPAIVIMSRLKSSGSLSSEKQVALRSPAFVPARNRTRIELGVTRAFNWPAQIDVASEIRIRQLVASEVADLDGFVVFDQGSRYQIELPGSWPEIEKSP
jgi:hypothetical protein